MRSVIVAEDDPVLRALLEEVLSRGGYAPVVCENGAVAWDRLLSGAAELAVVDYNMPVMDGLELIRRIRSHPRLKRMAVMMLTIRDLLEDQILGYESGADDYLTKPFTPEVLLARLRTLERRVLGASS